MSFDLLNKGFITNFNAVKMDKSRTFKVITGGGGSQHIILYINHAHLRYNNGGSQYIILYIKQVSGFEKGVYNLEQKISYVDHEL